MTYKTHVIGGILIGSSVYLIAPVPNKIAYLTSLAIGSILPDIDSPKSIISKCLYPVHMLISPFVEHRGITHTLLATAIVTTTGLLLHLNSSIVLGLSVGYLSHLLLDSFTISGNAWLNPFSKKRLHLGNIKTGSSGETCFAVVCLIALFYTIQYQTNGTNSLIYEILNELKLMTKELIL